MSNNTTKNWRKNGIVSKSTGLVIAPEDYHEGDKYHFTYDEAMAATAKLPDGWRLPTKEEWQKICKEFAIANGDNSEADILIDNLQLEYRGWQDYDENGLVPGSFLNQGSNGYYWSSTVNNTANAYSLSFNTSSVNPANSNNKRNGNAVRCVAPDLQKKAEPTSAEQSDMREEEGEDVIGQAIEEAEEPIVLIGFTVHECDIIKNCLRDRASEICDIIERFKEAE